MEFIELKFIEETEKYYFFDITIEENGLFSKNTTTYSCMREKNEVWSRFMSNGNNIFHTWYDLDHVINAILEKENKSYKKGD